MRPTLSFRLLAVALFAWIGPANSADQIMTIPSSPSAGALEPSGAASSGYPPVLASTSAVHISEAVFDALGRAETPNVLIRFHGQADISHAASLRNRSERTRYVFDALRLYAADAQSDVRQILAGFGRRESSLNDPRGFMTLWIDNSLAVSALRADELTALSQARGLRSIEVQQTHWLPVDPIQTYSPRAAAGPFVAIDSVTQIRAPQVWALGFRGAGITVANIDAGVRHTHAALASQYRGNLGAGNMAHDFNWFDPYNFSSAPRTTSSHGTHVMGTSVGSDRDGNLIGVAPDANWIACIGFGIGAGGATQPGLIACAQFALAPTDTSGKNPDPGRAAHVVNNSWAGFVCDGTFNPWFETAIQNLVAAGIVPIFAMGNADNCDLPEDPPLGQNSSPSNYGRVLSVGSSSNTGASYALHSIKGPTVDLNPGPPLYPDTYGFADLKPNVVAPGEDVISALATSDNGYGPMTGTSMSAPAVAGLIALMWDAAPCLIGNYSRTGALVMSTAQGIPFNTGSPSDGIGGIPNQATGWGEIDALAAINAARAECGGAGSEPVIAVSPPRLDLALREDDPPLVQSLIVSNVAAGTLNWTIDLADSDCDAPASVPWLVSAESSGATVPGMSATIALGIDASGLVPGAYSARVCVASDASNQSLLVVPVDLLVSPAGSQQFPAPYCGPVNVNADVEPISRVVFGGIDHSSSPSINGSPAHEDFLNVQTSVSAGSTVLMRVQGNTAGFNPTPIRAFFDWNRNGQLNDAGESYDIGTLENSNGTDGMEVVAQIQIPPGLSNGPVRMRVMKQFIFSPSDPCAALSYGQAEDYTIFITGGAGGQPRIAIEPTELSAAVVPDDLSLQTLAIHNGGDSDLDWSIVDMPPLMIDVTGGCAGFGDATWLSVNPDQGSTSPGQTAQVQVRLDASGLTPGEYAAEVCVLSNDPDAAVSNVPVSLTVTNDDPIFRDGFEGMATH